MKTYVYACLKPEKYLIVFEEDNRIKGYLYFDCYNPMIHQYKESWKHVSAMVFEIELKRAINSFDNYKLKAIFE